MGIQYKVPDYKKIRVIIDTNMADILRKDYREKRHA